MLQGKIRGKIPEWGEVVLGCKAQKPQKPRGAEPALSTAHTAGQQGSRHCLVPISGLSSHISLTESKRGRRFSISCPVMGLPTVFSRL